MVNKNYAFANPKAGISYQNRQTKVYLYYGQSSKEPNRDDFESGSSDQVKPERLHDWEAGIEQNGKREDGAPTCSHVITGTNWC